MYEPIEPFIHINHEVPLGYSVITRWYHTIILVNNTQDSTSPDLPMATIVTKTNTMLGLFDIPYPPEEEEG
jgi:hypothetical protein